MELQEYINLMVNSHGKYQWEIGWESLPKYIGHRIYNISIKKAGTVKWDKGYPQIFDDDGNEIPCNCMDFRHENANWIYQVGETYEM